jgi:hypothetical protein
MDFLLPEMALNGEPPDVHLPNIGITDVSYFTWIHRL